MRSLFALTPGDGANCIRVFSRDDEARGGGGGGGDGSSGGGSSWRQVCAAEGAHEADVNSVAWHPSDATLLASGGDDAAVRIWRLRAAGGGGAGGGGSFGGARTAAAAAAALDGAGES